MEYVFENFDQLLPKSGWLARYMDYTRTAEGSSVFQFFVGVTILGAVLKRNIVMAKGHYQILPTLQILLVAPSGKARKTSTANIGIKILREMGHVNLIADKTTPEALLDALRPDDLGLSDSQALLYAPELAVLLGRQKYNEGMVALLTSLFDAPEEFSTRTKGGGSITLQNVSLSFIGASTSDWLITTIPADAFGGGFMSRLLFIAQEDTPRCFPLPIEPKGRTELLAALREIEEKMIGMAELSSEAKDYYSFWYLSTRHEIPEDAKMGGYHERKPDHLLRLAFLLACAELRNLITQKDLQMSLRILNYIEKDMLPVFKRLGMRGAGIDQERIVHILKSAGGQLEYETLLHKNLEFLTLRQFRDVIETLIEAGVVQQNLDKNMIVLKKEK